MAINVNTKVFGECADELNNIYKELVSASNTLDSVLNALDSESKMKVNDAINSARSDISAVKNSALSMKKGLNEIIEIVTGIENGKVPGGSGALEIDEVTSLQVDPIIEELRKVNNDPTIVDKSAKIKELVEKLLGLGLTNEQLNSLIPFEQQLSLGFVLLTQSQIDALKKQGNGKFITDGSKYITAEQFELLVMSSSEYNDISNFLNNTKLTSAQRESILAKIVSGAKLDANGLVLSNNVNKMTTKSYKYAIEYYVGVMDDEELAEIIYKLTTGTATRDEEIEFLTGYLKAKFYTEGTDTCFNRVYDEIVKRLYGSDGATAMFNLQALAALAKDCKFVLDAEGGRVCGKTLYLETWSNCYGTTLHEFGHLVHNELCEDVVTPQEFEDMLTRAQANASANVAKLEKLLSEGSDRIYARGKKARNSLSHDDDEAQIRANINNMSIDELASYYGLSSETVSSLKSMDRASSSTVDKILEAVINELDAGVIASAKRAGNEIAVSDIVSAIYGDRNVTVNGVKLSISYAHDYEYWERRDSNGFRTQNIKELMANYNDLKMNGGEEEIRLLREIFGDELFDMLERNYASAR